jgi:hypothetical protein
MHVTSSGRFRVASVVWVPHPGTAALTVVCKATFQLLPGESPLAAEQDLPTEEENHWDDDPSRSLYSPCDLVPRKPHADVLLVGSAFAPRREPVRSLTVRLEVGGVEKAIDVFGDRAFLADGKLREGPGFVKMPLRWERAAGGPDNWNPVGVPMPAGIPNLQPPGVVIAQPSDIVPPIGFGPIAANWPERREQLGQHAGAWPHPGWAEHPLPDAFDLGYFNTAPRDQQLEALRGDERILLENLHPEHPHLVTRLEGIYPHAVIERAGQPSRVMEMRADTLWIDTDRGLCTLTWRGEEPLARRDEPVTVRIVAVRLPSADGGDGAQTMVPQLRATAQTAKLPALALPHDEIEEVSVEEEPPVPQATAVETLLLVPAAAAPAPVMPFIASSAPVPAPASLQPIESPVRPRSVGERAAGQIPAPAPSAPRARESAPGVLDASNNALGAPARRPEQAAPEPAPAKEPPARAAPREVVKLLWFDPRSVPRIRRHPEWRILLAELELRLLDEGVDEDEEAADAAGGEPKPKDRRDVLEVLLKGRPIGAEGVKPALGQAIGDDGRFEPPLVLLSGELDLPFDELATLRATAAAVSPFALGDRKLKEQLDVVEELLKTPWLQGSGSIARGLREKIEEVFAQGKRGVGPEYLAGHTERMLLEQRSYQVRTVFGKKWIRSLLDGSGVPVYVPEALRDELPMFKRFRVRLIGEVDMQEDQFEAAGAAVKVMAVGRVVG